MAELKQREISYAQWVEEGEKKFGPDKMKWKFVCPMCGHVATGEDWKAAGAPAGSIGFACIGRWQENPRDAFRAVGKGPCNYTGGGLFRLNPVTIVVSEDEKHTYFEFGESDV